MKKVYKFYWDCGRAGDVQGIFVADSDEVDRAIGRGVDFGEVLGKHSQVYGTLDREDLTVVADDPHDVELVEKIIGKGFGHNPLENLYEDDEDLT